MARTAVLPIGAAGLPPDEVTALRFGEVLIDPRAGVVRRGGVPRPLRPKAYDVLLYFARRPGRLASRVEVLEAVWPGVTVTDDSLVQCLVEIRRTLAAINVHPVFRRLRPHPGYLTLVRRLDLPLP